MSDAFAALGLCVDDAFETCDDEFWLWPENEEAFWFWLSIQTQWVVGMAGVVGLNYAGVEACMRMQGIQNKKRKHLFNMIQVMEQATLAERIQQE